MGYDAESVLAPQFRDKPAREDDSPVINDCAAQKKSSNFLDKLLFPSSKRPGKKQGPARGRMNLITASLTEGEGTFFILKQKMHNEIPFLTSYSYKKVIYALHAWYSSRTTILPIKDTQDGIPVSLLLNIRKKAHKYMEQIHNSGNGDLPA